MLSITRCRYNVLVQVILTLCIGFHDSVAAEQNSAGKDLPIADYRDNAIEEIVVTAQKREQSLQDVGVSVTAFSGEQLSELGMIGTRDLPVHTPGLIASGWGSTGTTTFTLRGSGQHDFADHHEAPVAMYADDAYLGSMSTLAFAMFDLNRVEVLRGPQGVLFGRNATGGLIHVLSNDPTDKVEAFADLQLGEYDMLRAEGAVGGPLTDSLSGRVAFLRHLADGYVDNSAGEDGYDQDDIAIRSKLLFEPNENLSFLLTGQWSKGDNGLAPYFTKPGVFGADGLTVEPGSFQEYANFCLARYGVAPTAPNQECFGSTAFQDDIHKVSTPNSGFMERENWRVTGKLDWDIGAIHLVSVTDFNDIDREFVEDVTSTNISPSYWSSFHKADKQQISQELRLSGDTDKYNWIAGFYYLNINGDFNEGADSPTFAASNLNNIYSLDTESYAFFVHGEYKLTPNWSITGGFRWTEDKKDYTMNANCFEFVPGICSFFYGGLVQNNMTLDLDRSEGEWSGLLQVDWRPNEDWLVYAKVSRGNKAGGFNGGVALLWLPSEAEYDGEILESVEVGFKSTWWGGRARLNASAFYYDYSNFQSFLARGISLLVSNVDAEAYGSELELIVKPSADLEFQLALALLDADQKDITFAGITRDRPMPNSPEVTFSGIGRYERPAFNNGSMHVQIDFQHVAERTWGAIDSPVVVAESYTVANARLGYTTADGAWDFSVWVKNFTDEKYFSNGADTTPIWAFNIYVPAPPRWVGGSIRYMWK